MKKIIIFSALLVTLAAISGCGTKENSGITENSPTQTSMTECTTQISAETSVTEKIPREELTQTTTTHTITTQSAESEKETADFSRIAGEWYIDGDYPAAHISISQTGTFTAYYASGNIENTGYIKYEATEGEESVNNWYVLYTDDGELYLRFINDGNESPLELYEVISSHRYVLINGAGGIADDGRGEDEILAEENYVGIWGCGRATLCISVNDDGSYLGKITWADSAFAYVEWIYPLTYDAESGKMVCNGNASKTYYEYKEENSDPVSEVMYTGGNGSFYSENGIITWYDDEENKGEDMEFKK